MGKLKKERWYATTIMHDYKSDSKHSGISQNPEQKNSSVPFSSSIQFSLYIKVRQNNSDQIQRGSKQKDQPIHRYKV